MKHVVIALRLMLVVAAVFTAGEWLRATVLRIRDPYPLDWLEGAVVTNALRACDGLPIYGSPAADFIPTLYPPLGYWVLGAAMKLFGAGLPAARATSAAATIGVVALLLMAVHRATRSSVAAVAAGGAFLAGFVACGSWYDLARNDMLFLLWGMASLFLLNDRTCGWRTVASAICASLALLTRQQGLVIIAAGFLHLLFTHRKEAVRFAGIVVLVVVPSVALLDRASDGWFLRFTWSGLGTLPIHFQRAPQVLGRMLATCSLPLAAASIWLVSEVRRRGWPAIVSPWALSLAAFFASSIMGMLREGGDVNHVIPTFVLALTMAGFALGELRRATAPRPASMAVLGLFCLMFVLWPRPSRGIPDPGVIRIQEQVREELRAIPGDVLALDDPFYLHLAGKGMNADGAAIFLLGYQGLDVPADLRARISGRRYAAIVLWEPVAVGSHARTASAREVNALISDHYEFVREIRAGDPRAERLRIPRYLYRARSGNATAQADTAS